MATIERHMARDLVTLDVGGSCRQAAVLMKERKIGAVAVLDGGEVVGLVAERDLALRVVGEGASGDVAVGDVVERGGPSVGPRATEKECADLMRQHHCRHLLVREEGKVTGLISMRDVIVLMLEEKEGVIRQLEGYIAGHCDADAVRRAAEAVAGAEALVAAAGAGMGVDLGLPDFRGPEGFWRAYPAYAKLGLRFEELADPRWFRRDPALAWGFYGHRLNLYRRTVPHRGFARLLGWAARARHGGFAFTSNVDGQFQRAGFAAERVVECHGTIEWLQCTRCAAPPFPAPAGEVDVDEEAFRAREPFPACASCGALARPNVLMFGDGEWDGARVEEQEARLVAWLRQAAGARLVVVECGAGTAVPSVRRFSEALVRQAGATLVRINPREPEAPRGAVSIAAGALDALARIAEVDTQASP